MKMTKCRGKYRVSFMVCEYIKCTNGFNQQKANKTINNLMKTKPPLQFK